MTTKITTRQRQAISFMTSSKHNLPAAYFRADTLRGLQRRGLITIENGAVTLTEAGRNA